MTISTAKQSRWWHGLRAAAAAIDTAEPMEDSYSPSHDRVAERPHGTKLLDAGPSVVFNSQDHSEWWHELRKMRAARAASMSEWINQ